MQNSAKAFIKATKRTPREGAREFFRRHGLRVRQPVPLATQHFIATHLAASGFVVRQIARAFDPAWTLCLRADQGAARRGFGAVRRGVSSAIQALGSGHPATDLLVHRRRKMFDVCFLYAGGSAGRVQLRGGRMTYSVARPHV